MEQSKTAPVLVVCVADGGYDLDLIPLKVYEAVPDENLEPGDTRVIDESGEDYIYPADYFIVLENLERYRDLAAAVERNRSTA